MGSLLKIIAGFALALALVAGAIVVFRAPIAGFALETALARAGFASPRVRVSAVTAEKLTISDVALGTSGEVAMGDIAASYNFLRILRERSLDALTIERASLFLRHESDGFTVAGRNLPLGGSASAGSTFDGDVKLPFREITIGEADIRVDSESELFDRIEARLSADWSADKGGGANVRATVIGADVSPVRTDALRVAAEIAAEPSGAADLRATLDGRLATHMRDTPIELEDLSFVVSGALEDWRAGLSAVGSGEVEIIAGAVRIGEEGEIATLLQAEARALDRPVLRQGALDGGFALSLADGRLKITSGDLSFDAPERQETITIGTSASVLPPENAPRVDAPLVAIDMRNGMSVVGAASLVSYASPQFKGSLDLAAARGEAASAGEAPILIRTIATIDDLIANAATLRAKKLVINGEWGDGVFLGAAELDADIEKLSVGRFSLEDTIVDATLPLAVNPSEGRLSFGGDDLSNRASDAEPGERAVDGNCLALPAARFILESPAMRGQLRRATFCSIGAPLLDVALEERMRVTLNGALSAGEGRLRYGETRIAGASPVIDLRADYRPDTHETDVTGVLRGGSLLVNDVLRASAAAGEFRAQLDLQTLTASGELTSARIDVIADPPAVAPVNARASGVLNGDDATFTFRLETLDGEKLGAGDGRHSVKTGAGEARFQSQDLQFSPGGLQPDTLAPVLRGFIGQATGAASASMVARWAGASASPGERALSTSGEVTIDDLSFRGPGVAISRTSGLTGALQFSSLAPLRTNGPQSVSIGGMDISALLLREGEAVFQIEDGNSLVLERAGFPWFGGSLTAETEALSLNGGAARATLRADDVDLSELLAFADIDGLTGEGLFSGVLPLVIEDGRARIEDGRLASIGGGVLRYTNAGTAAASQQSQATRLAFGILENLKFDELVIGVEGPLDGELNFNLLFKGANEIDLDDPRIREPVVSPIIYRINLEAPVLALIQNARRSGDYRLLIEEVRRREDEASSDAAQ
ncbi:MAG: YdbH domain-containing protein [Pseudomonadota bacterium]